MKIIIGLGNPGNRYDRTRHNAGFLALDFTLGELGFKIPESAEKFHSLILENRIGGQTVLWMKPQTYMNDSGKAVAEAVKFYKLDPSADILVIHDDVDLPLGTVRAATDSSAAGNNGVKSIIENLGTQGFHRLRIGVETRSSRSEPDTKDFVLSPFSNEDLEKLRLEVLPKVSAAVSTFLHTAPTEAI